MTAPKQEKWVRENQHKLKCGVVGSIGAVFDYFAGTVRRAPDWVCGMGLEWAYRLSREPAASLAAYFRVGSAVPRARDERGTALPRALNAFAAIKQHTHAMKL